MSTEKPSVLSKFVGVLKHLRYAGAKPERIDNADLAVVLKRIQAEKERFITEQNEINRKTLNKFRTNAFWFPGAELAVAAVAAALVGAGARALSIHTDLVAQIQWAGLCSVGTFAFVVADFLVLELLKPVISQGQFYVTNGKTLDTMISQAEKSQRGLSRTKPEVSQKDLLPVPRGTRLESGKVYNPHFETGSELVVRSREGDIANRFLIDPPGIFSLEHSQYVGIANMALVLTGDSLNVQDRNTELVGNQTLLFAVRSDGGDNRLIVGDDLNLTVDVMKPDSRMVAIFTEKAGSKGSFECGGSTEEALIVFQPQRQRYESRKKEIIFTGNIEITDPNNKMLSHTIKFDLKKDRNIDLHIRQFPDSLGREKTYAAGGLINYQLKQTIAENLKVTNLSNRMLVRCPGALVKVTGQFS